MPWGRNTGGYGDFGISNQKHFLRWGLEKYGSLEKLKEAWAEVMDMPPIAEYPVGNVISINTGPNMMGIIYRT